MKLLFVHQNFAGQYREILDWLIAQGGHEIVFLTQRKNVAPRDGVRVVEYQTHRKPAKDAYTLTAYWEECTGNGFGAAQAFQKLEAEGFKPDVPVLGYFEYFYLAQGGPVGFDPEYPAFHHACAQCSEFQQYRNR